MPGIDKVRLDNSYQQYQQRTPVKRTDEAKSQFPFDPDEKGVIYEPTGAGKDAAARDSAVTRETAAAPETTPVKETAAVKETAGAQETAAAGNSLTGWLFGLGTRFLSFLRGLWDVVWNGPEQTGTGDTAEKSGEIPQDEAAAEQEDTTGGIGKAAEETRADALQQIIADHDMEQLVQFVTEGGTKKPARSTDLLTIYNRYGRVNYVDPSDRKKILEGNFNDIKL